MPHLRTLGYAIGHCPSDPLNAISLACDGGGVDTAGGRFGARQGAKAAP
jgi:hypothetical protein